MRTFWGIFFLLNCVTVLSLNPSGKYLQTPEALGLNYKKDTVITSDNYHLNSWVLPNDTSQKHITIIVAGPDAGNMSNHLLLADALVKDGFSVVLFDYRGFGKSSDFKIDTSMLYYTEFKNDLAAVIKKTKTNFPENKTTVLAMSMGTLITSLASAEVQMDYVIADGLITNINVVKGNIESAKNITLKIPNDTALFYGKNMITAPTMVFSGLDDKTTTPDDAREFCKGYRNRKLVYYNGGHGESIKANTIDHYADNYIAHINSFFESLKQP